MIVGDPGECGYSLKNCEHGVTYVFVRDGSAATLNEEIMDTIRILHHQAPGYGWSFESAALAVVA